MTFDFERRMFCAMACFKFDAAAGLVAPLLLRAEAEDREEGSFWLV